MPFRIRLLTTLVIFGVIVLIASCWDKQPIAETEEARNVLAVEEVGREIYGFEEVSNAKDGSFVKVQGIIDQKFLCQDVTETQQDMCTTALGGSSYERKHMLVRLKVCTSSLKSNCID